MSSSSGETGEVFALVFHFADKESFALSPILMGQGITIVRPQIEGTWAGMTVVWSPEPCLPGPINWSPWLAIPIPDTVSVKFTD